MRPDIQSARVHDIESGQNFPKNIFKPVFLRGTLRILTQISLNFLPEYPTADSSNGLIPNRHQAITWTYDDLFLWSAGLNDLGTTPILQACYS